MSLHEDESTLTIIALNCPSKKCKAFFEQGIQRVLHGPNRVFHGACSLWYVPGASARSTPYVIRPEKRCDKHTSISTDLGLSHRERRPRPWLPSSWRPRSTH